jgi:hypothetical protein
LKNWGITLLSIIILPKILKNKCHHLKKFNNQEKKKSSNKIKSSIHLRCIEEKYWKQRDSCLNYKTSWTIRGLFRNKGEANMKRCHIGVLAI